MSLEGLRERARTLDPEPIAELATRMLELWTPPGHEAPMSELAAQALRDAGVDEVELDEEFAGSPGFMAAAPDRPFNGTATSMRSRHRRDPSGARATSSTAVVHRT
jgi:hypothetical protein